MGRRDGPGVFISALVPGGLAEQNGALLQVFEDKNKTDVISDDHFVLSIRT